MKSFFGIFDKIIAFCLLIAAIVVLAVSSVTTIYYDMHYDEDWPQYGRENIPLLVIFVLVTFAILIFLYRKGLFENCRAFGIAALLFITAYCLMLILSIHPQAVNDSKTLDDIINSFMEGDYSSLTEKGGYLFTWPYQLGYVFFGQIMYTLFGESNYFAWDILQLLCILATMFMIYRITRELFENRAICGITALLSCGALFFHNYVTYIYGDIISMAPQTLAIYMMILYVKRGKARYVIISGVSIAVAILLKTNCEIALIALLMVLVGSAFDGRAGRPIKKLAQRAALAATFLLLVWGSKSAINAYYCNVTGIESIPEGSPSWSHIAMGMQESLLEDGWYNGYNYHVFAENGYDTKATAAAARENIKETLTDFAHRPLHACRFFLRKFTTQWADSVCISTHNLDLVSRHVENQPALCDFLVFGTGSQILIWIMNIYMPVCYLGVVGYLINILFGGRRHHGASGATCGSTVSADNSASGSTASAGRHTPSHEEMLLLILIFGGIVFHEFWEGSSRYTMRYYIYYLPYAGFGIYRILSFIDGKLGQKK